MAYQRARFGKVRYTDVYPGIDLVYYGKEGLLEYDFVVAPGQILAVFVSGWMVLET